MTRSEFSSLVPSTNRYALAALICLGLLLLLRLFGLANAGTDLFFDEAQYWSWSQALDFGYFSKPPLIAWLIAGFGTMCGDSEFCIRAASPVLYALAAGLIYLTGRALYDERIGFWSAIVFATLPGISFSAGLISTDVPLLFFWTLALLAWINLQKGPSWSWALVLGTALGLGMMAKYAMVYFVLCAGVHMVVSERPRWMLRDVKGLTILALAALIVLPNILWNIDNGWITVSHTADNANWRGNLIKPLKMLEFAGSQFGVFGPILMAVLIGVAYGAARKGTNEMARTLLSFSLPIIALVTVQALLSRAHANWAATAYPAAAILVTATLLKNDFKRLFAASLGLHAIVLLAITVGAILAPGLYFPGRIDPFARVLGWRETAQSVRGALDGRSYGTILTEDRLVTAEMLYYLRDESVPVRSWRPGDVPRDHFEFSRPFDGNAQDPVLLVSLRPNVRHVSDHFARAEPLTSQKVAAGPKSVRTVYLTALSGYKGK